MASKMANNILCVSTNGLNFIDGNHISSILDGEFSNIAVLENMMYVIKDKTTLLEMQINRSKGDVTFQEKMQLQLDVNCSFVICAFDRFYRGCMYLFLENSLDMLVFYFNPDGTIDKTSKRVIRVCGNDENYHITQVTHQDGFFYVFHNGEVTIISPNHTVFGKMALGYHGSGVCMVGKDVYFVNDEGHLVVFELPTKKKRTLALDVGKVMCILMNKHDRILCLTCDLRIIIYNVDSREIENKIHMCVLTNETKLSKACSDFFVHHMTIMDFGNDYQHHNSQILSCHVKTYFQDQMDPDMKQTSDTILELADIIYNNPSIQKELSQNIRGRTNYPFTRKIEQCIYFGNDVDDIFNVPRNMFNHHGNYQIITKEMASLLDHHTFIDNRSTTLSKKFAGFTMSKGLYLMPSHYISGLLHSIFPRYAKGWHHNIDSAPRGTCDVVYLVATNANYYGGSFFLYRHPVSKKIHAVPDIHGTLKFFVLTNDPKNPLWHAIGSFEAIRLSFGLSKRVELETESSITTHTMFRV